MFGVIKIKVIDEKDTKEDFYCKLCEFPLITKDDFFYSKNFSCCHNCYLTFAEGRKEKWQKGWRPNKVEVDSYIKNINKLYENLGEKL